MRLCVVTEAPFAQLPNQLLSHLIVHSPDAFYKRSRPFAKLSIPPSYHDHQALCQQFGISPHSILCMEPALWRQQIVDLVTFDLSRRLIQIRFVDGSGTMYSFKEAQEILGRLKPHKPAFNTHSSKQEPCVCDQMTTALVAHLRFLNSLYERGSEFVADLNELCQLPSHQLAMLKRKFDPNPLTPTAFQVSLDDRRARQKTQIPVLIKKKPARRRRASSLGTPKPRHHIPSCIPALESHPLHPQLTLSATKFQLTEENLYQSILHLMRYRATLVDFFQSVVLPVLRAELPELYSLWILQSRITSLQEQFKNSAAELSDILYENQTLNFFQSLPHSHQLEAGSLNELKLWCELASTSPSQSRPIYGQQTEPDSSSFSHPFNVETPELVSTANTSLNELSSSLIIGNQVGVTDLVFGSGASSNPPVYCPIREKCLESEKFYENILPTLPGAINMPVAISPTNKTQDGLMDYPMSQIPLLSPPLDGLSRSHQSDFLAQSIFNIPLLLLEQDQLKSIGTENQRKAVLELVIELAEARLEMEKLNEKFRILRLLEEERHSREQFSGISRLSDIITTARLSLGPELGYEGGDISRLVRIKAAYSTVTAKEQEHFPKKTSLVRSQLSRNDDKICEERAPSKASEVKRNRAIKRKAWLATIRRLDRPWINTEHTNQEQAQALVNSDPFNSLWPEPIFLNKKSLKRKRKLDDTSHLQVSEASNLNPPPPPVFDHSTPGSHELAGPSDCGLVIPTTSTSPQNSSTSISELRKILLNL